MIDIISSSSLTSEQLNDVITITEFTIKKDDESTESFFINYTMNEGPIIPVLDDETKKLYDKIIALPELDTLSFYNNDETLKDINALYDSINAIYLSYQSCEKKQDLDTVLEFYDYSSSVISDLLTVISGMKNCTDLIEIYDTVKELEENKLINYQFIFAVYNNEKDNISITDIPENAPAYTQIQLIMSTLNELSDTLDVSLSTAEYLAKVYACEDSLYVIRELSNHKYYSNYLLALEEQIDTLITDIETNYTERNKEDLIDKLEGYQDDLEFFKQGISDIPTMTVENFKCNVSNYITFNRKSKLSSALSVSVVLEISNTNGKVIHTSTKSFPSNSKELVMNYMPSSKVVSNGQSVIVTAYYVVNDAEFEIDSVTRKCTLVNIKNDSNNKLNNSNTNNNLSSGNVTSNGGGTIFPSDEVPDKNQDTSETDTKKLFNDINNYSWANEAIEELYYAGIINGMEDGVFNPAGNVTREQFAKMVVQLFSISTTNSNTEFLDVKSDGWYAPYITAALQAGYIQGQSDEYFGIGESIMRQDMATILYRALGDQNKKAVLDFTDNNNIASYAQDAISELVGLGVINGYEDGSFNPRGTATRAEAAKMIYGVYKYLNK